MTSPIETGLQSVLAIVGPTAIGKSDLAMSVAEELNAEIISVDSAQLYRGMDIGTAKPTLEQRLQIPHHMIDIVDPDATMSVAEFQKTARAAIDEVIDRRRVPLLVGGSGLYFRAVVDPLDFPRTQPEIRNRIERQVFDSPLSAYGRLRELDPEAAERIEPSNPRRVIRALEVIEISGRKFSDYRVAWEDYDSIYRLSIAGLRLPRADLHIRIDKRVDEMIARGLVEEVEKLVAAGFRESLTSVQALGYAQVLAHFDGLLTLDEAILETKKRTRKFARRQLSWFRADPRVHWFEDDPVGAKRFLTTAATA